jgi:hypothetical protein
MLAYLLDSVFGCSHSRYTFPRTVQAGRNPATFLTGTYIVCLDCGKEIAYDWNNMTVIDSSSRARRFVRSKMSKHAA